MRKMIFALMAFVSLNAFAQEAPTPAPAPVPTSRNVLNCVVPVQTGNPSTSMILTLGADLSADFILLNITDGTNKAQLFSQMEKGELSRDLAKGSVSMLMLQESYSQQGGVIRNAGFFAVSKDENGAFRGFLSAMGNLYPLSCALQQ